MGNKSITETLKKHWLLLIGLVIVILILALPIIFTIFMALIMNLQVPERCDFSRQGLVCNNPMPVLTGSNLNFRLGNGFQKNITVTELACVDDVSAVASDITTWDDITDTELPYGTYHQFNTKCSGADSLKDGEAFKGKLFIKYHYANDVIANRTEDATIVVVKRLA